MQYFGFDRPSFGIKTYGFGESSPKLQADFTTGTYKADGATKTFADLFTFTRAGKAWLVKDTGLQEYAADVPRFDNGLLIEQAATSYSAPYENITLGNNTTRTANTYKTIAVESTGLYLQFIPLSIYPAGIPTLPDWGNTVITKAIKVAGVGTNQQIAITTRAEERRGAFARLRADLSVAGTGARYEKKYLYSVVAGFAGTSDVALSYPSQMAVVWGDIADDERTTPKVNAALDIQDFQYIKGTHPSTLIGDKSASSITRPSDFLLNKITGTTVTGNWDSTLTLSIVAGKLVHSGYGRIRSLEIN